MSGFDFDTAPERRGTGSYKWDSAPADVLPMWVADMDFRTAPCILEALRRRIDHGVPGYTRVPEEYYEATARWFDRRHGWRPDRAHFLYTSGVVPAISAIIKAMTRPGDGVAVLTPVFNCFFSSIRNNGCPAACVELRADHGDGLYHIPFDELERTAARPEVKVLLLCNPHNPGGRVWTRDELSRVADIARRHRLFVISDEIHCGLTYPGHDYTPWATVDTSADYAVCIAPTKAFNFAGLQIASIVAPDAEVRARIDRAININEVCDVNPLGVDATVAAYSTPGAEWLDALRVYLNGNFAVLGTFLADNLPHASVMPLESTYLAWVDLGYTGLSSAQLAQLCEERGKVMLSPGHIFGPGGEHHLRLNFACPRSRLLDGLRRMAQAINSLR